jgi:hypothetical protein
MEKTPGLGGFIGEIYQTFKEEIIASLHELFQGIKEKSLIPNSSYKTRPTSFTNIESKVPNKILAK